MTIEFLDSSWQVGEQILQPAAARSRRQAAGARTKRVRPRGAAGAHHRQSGMNRFVWNMRYPDATGFPGMILWAGSLTGPRVPPGIYT